MSIDPLKLEYQLCFRLYAASRNMTRVYQPLLDTHDLTYPQYILMLILFEYEQVDFKELSQMIDLKTGTMTPIVKKMEEMGLVTKDKNPADGRKINVTLTKKGKELKKELAHVPRDLAQKVGMTQESYQTLVKELDQLIIKLNQLQKVEGEQL